MTNRLNALTVVLERDIREDDAEGILEAISRLRGVLRVSGNVSDLAAHIAQERAIHELSEKIWAVLHPAKAK
jgi:hypothetical protein